MSTEMPETDAHMRNPDFQPHNPFQWRDFARSLERRNSELTARIAELEKEVDAAIELIPDHVRVREDGAFENLAASLAVSVSKLMAALAEARKDSAWQSIVTAPKDGTYVLVWCPASEWRGNNRQDKVTLGYWHQPGNPEKPGFWCGVMTQHQQRPTHWMPLPATPHPETKDGQL